MQGYKRCKKTRQKKKLISKFWGKYIGCLIRIGYVTQSTGSLKLKKLTKLTNQKKLQFKKIKKETEYDCYKQENLFSVYKISEIATLCNYTHLLL